ncbi:flagellar basal body rod protein FlgC [Succinispira mobilis]|uniref:flagellar basal body rod protein FlgC n=1 Tax=Succinispira mobilis TaxID=78120 RepID=UPI0003724557|nr:flagellar basal body rod protein FlgC [Succinispira mobilis]
MGMFNAIDIAASGMTAERLRLDVVSNNLANVNTTRTENGTPYRRQIVVFEPREDFESVLQTNINKDNSQGARIDQVGQGVRARAIIEDQSPFRAVYEPGHPDADAQGYVMMPNVNAVAEMIDMLSASKAYEANVAAVNAAKSMALKALDIGK